MKKAAIIIITCLLAATILNINISEEKKNNEVILELKNNDVALLNNLDDRSFIFLDAGKDIITYERMPTTFEASVSSPEGDDIELSWDFTGDGHYDTTESVITKQKNTKSYVFDRPGEYIVKLKATDPYNSYETVYDEIKVIVNSGFGMQKFVDEPKFDNTLLTSDDNQEFSAAPRKFAVMINGGSEERFWIDVEFTYKMFLEYGFTDKNIFVFNHDGTNPDGENPNGIIDYPARESYIQNVFNYLANIVDSNDLLFVWVTDHGGGYYGSNHYYYGFTYCPPEIDPGDEQDYLEQDLKYRSLFTSHPGEGNHGMGEWQPRSANGYYKRVKYLSNFDNIYFKNYGQFMSNHDIWIERIVDYLAGDFNNNGKLEVHLGEIYDFDRDGNPPYTYKNGELVFDEDDWGEVNLFDTYYSPNGMHSQLNAVFFDPDFDNLNVCIDVNYDGREPEIDGCDVDNQGLFDGIDINEDGDMRDWVSMDEFIYLYYGDWLIDDELQDWVNQIDSEITIAFLEPCFSGGFIWDIGVNLTSTKKIVMTACEQETPSGGNYFIRNFASALLGFDLEKNPVDADANGDGNISMVEAFNYATENDPLFPGGEIPQYEDNGDGEGHTFLIPNGGDGFLGSETFLK